MENKICNKCGAEMPIEAKFCTKCGQSYEEYTPGNHTHKEKLNKKSLYALLTVFTILLLIIFGTMFFSEYEEKTVAREKFYIETDSTLVGEETDTKMPTILELAELYGETNHPTLNYNAFEEYGFTLDKVQSKTVFYEYGEEVNECEIFKKNYSLSYKHPDKSSSIHSDGKMLIELVYGYANPNLIIFCDDLSWNILKKQNEENRDEHGMLNRYIYVFFPEKGHIEFATENEAAKW